MTATNVERRNVPHGKFLAAIAIAFALQVGLLFWASDRTTVIPAKPNPRPAYRLGDSRAPELIALEDPTLFVLPHVSGFSGDAWMKMPKLSFQSKPWSSTEPLRWLANPTGLGKTLNEYIQSHPHASFPIAMMPEAAVTFPTIAPTPRLWPPSTLRIRGDLANRRFLNPPSLPFAVEAVTNSVVEVLIDPDGETFSAVLSARSGSTNNLDDLALRIARASRFESIEPIGPDRASRPAPEWMQGTMIFQWQPQPPTNSGLTIP